ncbi:MAG: class I SAM-dependent methyltransferase [Anderseniella sp.]|nr:class I SAM-dependent methyltransferase [Anderseniella sp.]
MVFDEYRNELYATAIRKLVTPDSVVLDLGAGLGVHGLLAAAARVKRVYLVEPEPVVQLAKEIARANGLADRIVILEGRIEEVELPEQVDLIISVFTGNLLYSEDLLPSLFHARDRYLKPGGHLVPNFAELLLAPVSAPDLHAKHIGRWSEPHLGLDFSASRRFAANEIIWPGREELKAERLATGVVVSTVDMTQASHADCRGEARCRIETSGPCHGLLGWTRIRLADQWLSTDPASPEVHWSPAVLPFDPPLSLEAGEDINISLQRPAHGDWTWSIKAASGTRRHSSFLARTDGPRRLSKVAADASPGLGRRGQHALHVLAMMQAGHSIREIAQSLADSDRHAFQDFESALQHVQALAVRYGGNG